MSCVEVMSVHKDVGAECCRGVTVDGLCWSVLPVGLKTVGVVGGSPSKGAMT